MSPVSPNIRWLRIVSGAIAVIGISFVILMLAIAIYATTLAIQVRGTPDQGEIGRFAASLSPRLMPWLECLLAFLLSFGIFRKTEDRNPIHGLLLGLLAGAFGLALVLLIRGHLSLPSAITFFCVVGLGWIGGLCAKKWPTKHDTGA
jgi:hypothetical protein